MRSTPERPRTSSLSPWPTSWHVSPWAVLSSGNEYRPVTMPARVSAEKNACGLEALTRSHFPHPHYDDEFHNFPTEVCTGVARTKEQSQRRVSSLIPEMVFNDRPTLKDRHARNSSGQEN